MKVRRLYTHPMNWMDGSTKQVSSGAFALQRLESLLVVRATRRVFSSGVISGYPATATETASHSVRPAGLCPTPTYERGASYPQAAPCGFPMILPAPPVDNSWRGQQLPKERERRCILTEKSHRSMI